MACAVLALATASAVRFGAPPSLGFASASRCAATMSDKKQVLVPIAAGSEEIEAVCIIDTLVRAGAQVTVASVMDSLEVTCSRGVKITADMPIAEAAGKQYDAIVVPGGMPGAEHLANSAPLTELLKAQATGGKLTAAICAAPVVVLAKHGLLDGKKATAHPAFSDKLPDQGPVPTRVVVRAAPTPASPRARAVTSRCARSAPARRAAGAGGRERGDEPWTGHRARVCPQAHRDPVRRGEGRGRGRADAGGGRLSGRRAGRES